MEATQSACSLPPAVAAQEVQEQAQQVRLLAALAALEVHLVFRGPLLFMQVVAAAVQETA